MRAAVAVGQLVVSLAATLWESAAHLPGTIAALAAGPDALVPAPPRDGADKARYGVEA